eukprot:s1_g2394.t1
MSFRNIALGVIVLIVAVGAIAEMRASLVSNFYYALAYERTLDAYSQADTTETDVTNTIAADGSDAALLSAFFGLDDALPALAGLVICEGANGKDGMPIIFSQEVDPATLEPGDIKVITASGSIGEVMCLTLAPADDVGELRTALLVGQYGSADDQPKTVEIVGNILSADGTVNFKGLSVEVTPLENGPTLVMAEIVPMGDWSLGSPSTGIPFGGGSGCPAGTKQIVRAVWDGGVTKPNGRNDADDLERQEYKVTVERADGSRDDITPFALADLGDGDNNHKLCLDTEDPAVAVSFSAGYLTDPREDLNPATSVNLTR